MVITDNRTCPSITDDHMSPRTATMVYIDLLRGLIRRMQSSLSQTRAKSMTAPVHFATAKCGFSAFDI